MAQDGEETGDIAEVAAHDYGAIDSRDGREERRALLRDDESQAGVRECLADRGDGGRGQDEIADTFELNEKDVQGLRDCSGAAKRGLACLAVRFAAADDCLHKIVCNNYRLICMAAE